MHAAIFANYFLMAAYQIKQAMLHPLLYCGSV